MIFIDRSWLEAETKHHLNMAEWCCSIMSDSRTGPEVRKLYERILFEHLFEWAMKCDHGLT